MSLSQSRVSPDNDEFLTLVEGHQGPIYGFVLSLIADPHVARDILQEVNLVLWRKSETFTLGTNFRAWAFKIARLQVLAHRKKLARDSKRLLFNDELLETVAAEAGEIDEAYEQRSQALQACLKQLPERQRNVVIKRYLHGVSVTQIATELRLQANAVSQLLHRSRQSLGLCIRKKLAPSPE
tara:strand:- start:146 stop:691 length:546 start_codon:yes stop_codon:yes gene_type:complete